MSARTKTETGWTESRTWEITWGHEGLHGGITRNLGPVENSSVGSCNSGLKFLPCYPNIITWPITWPMSARTKTETGWTESRTWEITWGHEGLHGGITRNLGPVENSSVGSCNSGLKFLPCYPNINFQRTSVWARNNPGVISLLLSCPGADWSLPKSSLTATAVKNSMVLGLQPKLP